MFCQVCIRSAQVNLEDFSTGNYHATIPFHANFKHVMVIFHYKRTEHKRYVRHSTVVWVDVHTVNCSAQTSQCFVFVMPESEIIIQHPT